MSAPAESPAPASRIAPAFRAGVAIAAAQLVGAANDGRRVAAEALAAPLHATGTHSGSRAGRLAVRCISATLRACGVDVIG